METFYKFLKINKSNDIILRPIKIFTDVRIIYYKFPKCGGAGLFTLLDKLNLTTKNKYYINVKHNKKKWLEWLESINIDELMKYEIITVIRNPIKRFFSHIDNSWYHNYSKNSYNNIDDFIQDIIISTSKRNNINYNFKEVKCKNYSLKSTDIFHIMPINLFIPNINIFDSIINLDDMDEFAINFVSKFNIKLNKSAIMDLYTYKNKNITVKKKLPSNINLINKDSQLIINKFLEKDIFIYEKIF